MERLKQFITGEYCLQCQGCCRFAKQESVWSPKLLSDEKAKIAPFSKKVQLLPNPRQGNFACQFLNQQNNKCSIYTIRPFECQLYPFLINRQGKKVCLAVDLKCPFIKKNAHLEEYKRYVEYLIGYFKQLDVLAELRKNPEVIQPYDRVLDVFVINL
jgi:Fe-S-cluster containining protein